MVTSRIRPISSISPQRANGAAAGMFSDLERLMADRGLTGAPVGDASGRREPFPYRSYAIWRAVQLPMKKQIPAGISGSGKQRDLGPLSGSKMAERLVS